MRIYKIASCALKTVIIDDDFHAENCGTVVYGLTTDVSQTLC